MHALPSLSPRCAHTAVYCTSSAYSFLLFWPLSFNLLSSVITEEEKKKRDRKRDRNLGRPIVALFKYQKYKGRDYEIEGERDEREREREEISKRHVRCWAMAVRRSFSSAYSIITPFEKRGNHFINDGRFPANGQGQPLFCFSVDSMAP